jgi:ribonuclease HI
MALNQIPAGNVQIYTDGSRVGEQVGAAFVVFPCVQGWQGKLQRWCSVLTAEMVAIERAIIWAAEECPDGTHVSVITDSRSALAQLQWGDHGASNVAQRTAIYIAARQIVAHGGSVSIGWVPSHCGVAGNEKADALAGTAWANGDEFFCSPTKQEVRRRSTAMALKTAQCAWDVNHHHRYRYCVEPQLQQRAAMRLPRRHDVFWTRLRLGYARMADWTLKVRRRGTGDCTGCVPPQRETLQHVLFFCDAYRAERHQMWLDTKIPVEERTMRNLLSDSQDAHSPRPIRLNAILQYLNAINKREEVILPPVPLLEIKHT